MVYKTTRISEVRLSQRRKGERERERKREERARGMRQSVRTRRGGAWYCSTSQVPLGVESAGLVRDSKRTSEGGKPPFD